MWKNYDNYVSHERCRGTVNQTRVLVRGTPDVPSHRRRPDTHTTDFLTTVTTDRIQPTTYKWVEVVRVRP